MFMGDFLQFPPINDTPLYLTNIQLIFTFTKLIHKKFISKAFGKIAFDQIVLYSIIVIEQMKQNKKFNMLPF